MKLITHHCESFLNHKNLISEKMREAFNFELGYLYFHLGDYIKATYHFEENLITLNKNNKYIRKSGEILTCLGDIYNELGVPNKAQEALETKSHYLQTRVF